MDECDLKIIARVANCHRPYLILAGEGAYRRVLGWSDTCQVAVRIAARQQGQRPKIYWRVRGEYKLWLPREVTR